MAKPHGVPARVLSCHLNPCGNRRIRGVHNAQDMHQFHLESLSLGLKLIIALFSLDVSEKSCCSPQLVSSNLTQQNLLFDLSEAPHGPVYPKRQFSGCSLLAHVALLTGHRFIFTSRSLVPSLFLLRLLMAMRTRALFSKYASILRLVEQVYWRMTFITEWSGVSSFEVILARQSKHSSTWASPLFGDGFGCVDFCTLFLILSETVIVSFRTLPLAFHCQLSPAVLCSRCFVPDS